MSEFNIEGAKDYVRMIQGASNMLRAQLVDNEREENLTRAKIAESLCPIKVGDIIRVPISTRYQYYRITSAEWFLDYSHTDEGLEVVELRGKLCRKDGGKPRGRLSDVPGRWTYMVGVGMATRGYELHKTAEAANASA